MKDRIVGRLTTAHQLTTPSSPRLALKSNDSAAARCRRCHLAIVTTTDAERKNIKQQGLVSNLAFWWNSLNWLKLRRQLRQQWDNGLTSHFRSGRQSLSCCFQIDFQYWKYQRERGEYRSVNWKYQEERNHRPLNQIGRLNVFQWTLSSVHWTSFWRTIAKIASIGRRYAPSNCPKI